jgi:uncharacterized membrane protein YhaH (DUF805 family)
MEGGLTNSKNSILTKQIKIMNYYLNCLINYFAFKGRARRSEYWFFTVFNFLFSTIFTLIGMLNDIIYLGLIYNVAMLLPSLSVGVRRMHDVGKSGWYLLVPFYNLILAFTEGDKGDNQYGNDPKN